MVDWNVTYARVNEALDLLPRRADGKVSWGNARVAHLDTGYTNHPAFGPWNGEQNAIVLTGLGRDFLAPQRGTAKDPLKDPKFMEPGHGTRSGSALSADGGGFTGVAPGLPLVPFRVTNTSLVTGKVARAIAKALDHVVDNRVASVVNISLGFPLLDNSRMGKAVDKAYEAGVIVVAAAGQEIDRMSYPAKHRRTIGVGGITKTRRRHIPYQKYDRYARIDIWAPAKPVRRAHVKIEKGRKQMGGGTTYAAVHVTAAACMWLRVHGGVITQRYGATWKRVEAFRRLLATVKQELEFPLPDSNEAGALDIDALLRADLPDPNSLVKEMDLARDDRF